MGQTLLPLVMLVVAPQGRTIAVSMITPCIAPQVSQPEYQTPLPDRCSRRRWEVEGAKGRHYLGSSSTCQTLQLHLPLHPAPAPEGVRVMADSRDLATPSAAFGTGSAS